MKYRMARRKKKKRSKRPYALFILALFFFFFLILNFFHKKEPLAREKKAVQQFKAPASLLKESKYFIQKGMTLTDILIKHDLSTPEIYRLREEAKPIYDLAKIKYSHEFRVFSAPDGKVKRLEYDIDDVNYLEIRKVNGEFKGKIKKIPYKIRVAMIFGIIEDNLISAVLREGETDYLALSLAEIFSWDIDFYADLRKGDTFKIIFEKKYLNNELIGYRNIVAAEFINQRKTFQAFRYTYPDTGKSDYFDLEGDSLRKEFLKSPIKFVRITSRFSLSRLHPIRKVFRPHYGVDYAAKVGTPVQATADGTVISARWNGASGRMVRIRHKNAYETMYLHLRNFARGIKKGAKVTSGQLVGQVGSSGESTGPHLDYRIKYRERYINPLSWRFEPVNPLRTEFLEDFKSKAEKYIFCFEMPQIIFSCFYNSVSP